jgi:outer membrane biosynthesis protein TonB
VLGSRHTLVALVTGIALAGAPLPLLAAPAAEGKTATEAEPAADAAEPAEGEAPAEGEPAPAAEPGEDAEDPLAEPAPKATPTPAPAPAPAPKPKREPKVDPLGLGLAVGGYALLVVSVGLFAGMGVQMKKGEDANDTIQSTTTPDTEMQRMTAFADGEKANENARNFGIAAGVVLVVGIALVATGHVLMKRKKDQGARAQLLPSVGPQHAGLTWRVAF